MLRPAGGSGALRTLEMTKGKHETSPYAPPLCMALSHVQPHCRLWTQKGKRASGHSPARPPRAAPFRAGWTSPPSPSEVRPLSGVQVPRGTFVPGVVASSEGPRKQEKGEHVWVLPRHGNGREGPERCFAKPGIGPCVLLWFVRLLLLELRREVLWCQGREMGHGGQREGLGPRLHPHLLRVLEHEP